jgi:uncharacterized RDD family membrane protein YckC
MRRDNAGARDERSALPDWRLELNEKVRAIKARRSMEARIEAAAVAKRPAPPPPAPPPPAQEPAPEPANPIVAAALDRVRRASESAASARVVASGSAAAAPRQAEQPRVAPLPLLAPTPAQAAPAPAPVAEPSPAAEPLFDPSELLEGFDAELNPIEEVYEEAPAAEREPEPFVAAASRPASLVSRALAGVIDAAVVCLTAVPFVATVELVDGDFSDPAVLILLSSTLALLAAFYLFVTLALGGRTVGMVYSRSRVVSAGSESDPGVAAMLLRVAGYFVAALPLGLGFAWAAFDSERRGWHDLLSGTRVVEG